MRIRRSLAVLAAVASVAVAFAPAPAAGRTERRSYAGGFDGAVFHCSGVGGACFSAGGGSSLSLRIEDASGRPVAGRWEMWGLVCGSLGCSERPLPGATGEFCESASGIGVPAGALTVRVIVSGALGGPGQCLGRGSAGAGSAGTIVATFS